MMNSGRSMKLKGQQGFTKATGVFLRGIHEDVEVLGQPGLAVGRHGVAPHEQEANALRDQKRQELVPVGT